jgi:hypothetical protein
MSEEQVPQSHNLSGVYIRFKNPVTGEMENRVFEDLPESAMRTTLEGRSEDWLKEMVIIMSKCLHTIADEFQISSSADADTLI